MSARERLARLLAEEGPLVAGALTPGPDGEGSPALLAARGPRAADAPDEYELVVEAIYEGYLLHHGESRLLAGADGDLAVLLGDHLYALGLERLVELGDIAAVVELAETIALAAQCRAAGDERLAQAVWQAGARAVGWGGDESHDRAKRLVAEGSTAAFDAMSTSIEAFAEAD